MNKYVVAIDPWALLLPSEVYQKWVEGKHPHVPSLAEVQRVVRAMPARQRSAMLARAKEIMADCEMVQEAVAGVK